MSSDWLLNRARELRHEQVPHEQQLWHHLRAKRFANFKFRRQHPIGEFIVDFVCLNQRLIIELDGRHHAVAKDDDTKRDQWLQTQGFRILRFWNNEWTLQQDSVLQVIWNALHKDALSPNPSPASGQGKDSMSTK